MKNNASLKGLLIALTVAVLAFAVYFLFLEKNNTYLVDNPTPKTFYFKLNNGKESVIASGQYVEVDVKKGKNKIRVFDQNKKLLYDSAFTVKRQRGLLNIAHQDYYIHRQYYGYDVKKDSLLLALDQVKIDGKTYFGGAKRFNKLYTEDFYYNVDEDYDQIIKNIDKVESRTKIFRKQDFLNYYKEYYKF